MSMLRVLIVSLSLIIFAAAPSFAQCYSKAEAEAEQGIRIHSELMVIGLNCQSIGARYGHNFYGDYRNFTARNAGLFGKYEQILMNFFNRNGKPAKASLNKLRTDYANVVSKNAANMRPDIFCAKYSDRITKTKNMGEAEIRRWASTLYEAHPVSYPLCQ